MKVYSAENIRNIALLGHSSSGKTTLTEAALFATGAIKRQGRVDDGNTVSDFGKEEIERKVSIGTACIPVEYQSTKFNLLDTPGYFDFIGEMYGAKRASEGTVLLVDAGSGVEVGTEKAWNNLEKYNTPRIIFINKMDREDIDFDELMEELKTKLGDKVVPFAVPTGLGEDFNGFIDIIDEKIYSYKDGRPEITEVEDRSIIEGIKAELDEKIAESDEELMLKYFEGQSFTYDEAIRGLKKSVVNGDLVPVVVGSAEKSIGVEVLLDAVKKYLPAAGDTDEAIGYVDGEEAIVKATKEEPFSAVVFKTIVDPYIGKISLFRVISGKLTEDTKIYNSTKEENEKLTGLYFLRGKEQIETDHIEAGDIGATTRLEHTTTGDTLCDRNNVILYETIEYPQPTLFSAVIAKDRNTEDKLGPGLQTLKEEDPTFTVERNAETKQLLIGGQGSMQLRAIVEKLKNTYDVDVELVSPKIAYRETIKGKSDVQGRHKKQSGGAGQYGDVHIRFEPCEEEFIFEEEVFGGSVPKNYFPAVEKGIEDSRLNGVLAGYPVVNFKATLHDGSHHPVDSNEMAFKIAASMAFKKGIKEAKPILLEPVMSLEIEIPEEYLGDIMGDMNKRRGRILGMEQDSRGNQIVSAEAPHSELFEYAIDLRAMTQSRGKFQMEFLRYDEVPKEIAEKIIEEKMAKEA